MQKKKVRSFVDFGATLLNLAGVAVPDLMDGVPFLGGGVGKEDLASRCDTYGYADRFDEKYDLCRSLRRGRFKYLRHYQAFYPDGLHNDYRYKMVAFEDWRDLHRSGQLEGTGARFFEAKSVESLFDLETDPDELRDLATDPVYADVLVEMRDGLQDWVKGLPDLSFFPESIVVDHALDDGIGFGQSKIEAIGRLIDIADLALQPFADIRGALTEAMDAEDPWERYWPAIVCSCFGTKAEEMVPLAAGLLQDPEPLVRVRAAEFLALIGAADPRPVLLDVINTSSSTAEVLLTLNTAVFVHDHLDGYPLPAQDCRPVVQNRLVDQRIAYLRRRGELQGDRSTTTDDDYG